jgi:transcriptional regulator with XRE-family HTH domain
MPENWFKQRRTARHLTQRQIAAAVGCTVPLVGFWEHDRSTPPARVANELAAVYGVAASDVLAAIAAQSQRLHAARRAAADVLAGIAETSQRLHDAHHGAAAARR